MTQSAPRILLVNEDCNARKALKQSLTEAGYLCEEASTGASAMGMLRRSSFEVAIVNLEMRGSSGSNLPSEIARKYPEIAIVAGIPQRKRDRGTQATGAGASYGVIKPLDISAMPEIVNRVLGERAEKSTAKRGVEEGAALAETSAIARMVGKEDFLHAVAQEIKTPLTAVIACSEMLEDSLFSANEQQTKRLADNIKKSAWLLNKNLQRLLEDTGNCEVNAALGVNASSSPEMPSGGR
jgi:DNA-binding NtrC family response regulator